MPQPVGSPLEPGTLVWVHDKEGGQVWIKAEVTALDGDKVQVRTDDGDDYSLASADKIHRCNADTWKSKEGLTGVHDLSKLTHLHEPEVLHALQLRFDVDHIYTFCGPILIAVNPFKDMGDLYANVHDKKYKDTVKPPPHIYTVASRAFEGLANARLSQVVLISGESGAGKTETTKHVLKFLTSQLSDSKRRSSSAAVGKVQSATMGTEKKVLNSNPILEAFGNACTVRNNNSSRFGKFIKLRFQTKGGAAPIFSNAAIDTYLLEKVRVTKIDKQERSYHMFYQACAAKQMLDFVYLNQSDRFELAAVDDSEEFIATRCSMEAMDISLQEQAEILRIVAGVLHIGNISIREKAGKVEVEANASLKAVCEIMGIDLPVLTRALTHKLIAVGSERYDSPLTLDQSEARRESFARMIYSYLFNHMVFRINESLSSNRAGPAASSFIGVLDIFGFEHFKVNSFEQLCINFANERLQQMFNHFVFEVEMELYKQEGITCDFSDFPDNQGIIDLIQAKTMSIFTLLDEECRMPKGSDKSLVQKLWKQFDKHENFKIEARKNMCFTVIHFAGPVSYDGTNFMDKNMDELGELLKQAIEGSSNSFVRSLLEPAVTEGLKSPSEQKRQVAGRAKTLKPHTVATDFKSQLESLVTKMKSAGPHFVRCIKPNPEKAPGHVERQLVVEQLRSGGVIEALQVQRAGFPCRNPVKTCWKDFLSLVFRSDERKRFEAMKDACLKESLQQLAKELKWPASSPLYAIGKTTVFFKQVAYETIEGMRIAMLAKSAKKIQGMWRVYLMRSLFSMIRERGILIQATWRRYAAKCRVWNMMKPAQRRRSRLFRAFLEKYPNAAKSTGETDSEEERELQAERERLERLKATKEEQERQRKEEEKRQKEEEERRLREEEEERQRLEEERIRLEQEAIERRRQEELQRLEQAKLAAMEEERQRAEELRQLAEKAFQEEKAALQVQHNEELRQLRSQVAASKDEQEVSRTEHEAEIQRLKEDVETQKLLQQEQATSSEKQSGEMNERIQSLEEENARLKKQLQEQQDQHTAQLQDLEAAHRDQLTSASEQLETQRQAYVRQMEEMRESLDEQHRQEQDSLKTQEQEQGRRFQEELQQLREREAQQRQKHEEQLKDMRARDEERQRKIQEDLGEALRDSNKADLEKRLLEERVNDSKAEMDQTRSILEIQQEELKRVHQIQVDMLEQRSAEKERALQNEVEILRKQKDSQVASLRAQLEFQTTELRQTAEQEVSLLKQDFERRERSLQQMLEQARLGQEEETRTAEIQLAMKLKRQEELLRASEAKIKSLEESSDRQQELYERHVGQLSQQIRSSQENFRSQLEVAQSENDEQLQAAIAKLSDVERNSKSERERMRAEVEQEREEQASKLAQAEELGQQVATLQREIDELRQQLLQARMKLLDRPTRAAAATDAPKTAKAARRMSESQIPEVSNIHARRKSTRIMLLPAKLQEAAATKDTKAEAPKTAPKTTRPALRRRTTFAAPRSMAETEILPLRFLIGGDAIVSKGKSGGEGTLLRPSLQKNGKIFKGDATVWQRIDSAGLPTSKPSEGAVTVLCFRECHDPSEKYELLAVGCKSGTLSIFKIRRTGLERNMEEETSEDIEVVTRAQAHAKAITSMCFTAGGDSIITSSSDWTVRVYNIKEERFTEEFTDTSLVVCAVSLPKPDALITANANAVLQLRGSSAEQQKVRLDHYARSLMLALGGRRLLAGTSRGHVHFFEISAQGLERLNHEGLQVGQNCAALTCLTLAPCPDNPPLVLANCMDNTVCIMQANEQLTNLTVQRRLANAHRLLPLRSSHVPGYYEDGDKGAGFVASGAEDGKVRVFDLESFTEQSLESRAVPTVPVVDVAVTKQGSLMASGDVHGRVFLWRRGGDTNGLVNGH